MVGLALQLPPDGAVGAATLNDPWSPSELDGTAVHVPSATLTPTVPPAQFVLVKKVPFGEHAWPVAPHVQRHVAGGPAKPPCPFWAAP